MTEEDFINAVKVRNATLMQAEKIQLTPAALIKALREAWRSGRKSQPAHPQSIFDAVFGSALNK